MKLDHIGLAVNNIEEYFNSVLAPVFDCKMKSEIFTDSLQNSKIAFVETSDGTRIELIEPLTPDSPVSAILRNGKGGLYHLCFLADDFEKDMEKLRKNKFTMISSPKKAIAFNKRRVAFFLSPSNEVIELVEKD